MTKTNNCSLIPLRKWLEAADLILRLAEHIVFILWFKYRALAF